MLFVALACPDDISARAVKAPFEGGAGERSAVGFVAGSAASLALRPAIGLVSGCCRVCVRHGISDAKHVWFM